MIIDDENLKKSVKQKTIYNLLPQVTTCRNNVTPLKSGDYLLKIKKSEKNHMLNIKNLSDNVNNINIPVKFQEAWNMNQTKVTIKSKQVQNCTNSEELTLDLKAQNENVVCAEIQTKFENHVYKNTEFAVVTLSNKYSELELKNIKLYLYLESLPVKLYIPPPRRCKVCWSYDHFSSKNRPCNRQRKCGNCGKDFHLKIDGAKLLEKCKEKSFCIHCCKEHPVWYKECQRFIKEKKVWEIATKQNMSYGRALHILNQQKEEKDQSRIRATYATATGQTNENQTTRQNDSDNIFQ